MSTQQTTYIPKFSYPFAQKDKNVYKEKLGVSKEGNYLFTQHGFWHGGIHFEGDMLTDLKANEGIKCIADGELVAYRINENYLNEGRGFYSTGFFLVRHKIEYPTNNKLIFFSLYMHTANKDAYNIIQNQTNQSNTNYYTVKKGDTLGKIAKVHNTTVDKLRQDNNIADVNKIREGHVLIIKTNNHNPSSQTSQPTPSNSNSNSNPNFIVENPLFDEVVILPTPKKIKAGEYLGLMGEYNVDGEKDIKCLHLEVFANEEFKTFVQTAQRGDKNLPQSFSWAKVLDTHSSSDHTSIFEDIKALFDDSMELKLNVMFKDLFREIDNDQNGQLFPEEIEDSAKNPTIKEITNNYIVKHSSEWDKTENMAEKMITAVQTIPTERLEDKEQILKDLELEKQRIKNLSFFTECKSIQGFPQSDMVYVMNPVGLVEAFEITIKRRDHNLGTLSSRYETGGRGSITVSSGIGDIGGVSYGSYQLTSEPSGGNVKRFINDESFIWKNEFIDLIPGSQKFSKKWKELVILHGNNFSKIEHEYIRKKYFDIQIQKIITEIGIDIRYHSHTLNDVVWSTSVHNGSRTLVVIKAINKIQLQNSETKEYDKALIEAIYKERGKKDENGILVYFPSTTNQSVINGLNDRFIYEKDEALRRLNSETDY